MSFENITLRPKKKKASPSSDIDDLFLTSPSSNYSMANSLPDLPIAFKDNATMDMEEEIRSLKCQLESAHNQIDELLLEKTSLNKITQEQYKQITYLKSICTGTPMSDLKRYSLPRKKTKAPCRKTLDFENIRTPQTKINDLENSNIRMNNIQVNPPPVLLCESAKKPANIETDIPLCLMKMNDKPSKNIKTDKPKIVILGDEYVRGLSRYLIESRINTWNDCYTVTSMSKPGASSSSILSSVPVITPIVTKEDVIVISVGSNDKNPFTLLSELSIALDKLAICKQVYLLKVQHNPFLNVNMLNNNIKLLLHNFKNCKVIDIYEKYDCDYNNMYKRNKNHLKAFCFKLNVEIDYLKYHEKFISGIKENPITLSKPMRVKNYKTHKTYRQNTISQYFIPTTQKENVNTMILLAQDHNKHGTTQQIKQQSIELDTFRK